VLLHAVALDRWADGQSDRICADERAARDAVSDQLEFVLGCGE